MPNFTSLEGRAVARAATGMVGGRLGERTVQSAGHCRFVASQPEVACGSDRNGDVTARAEMQVVFALETLHLSVLSCPSGVAAANFSLVLLAPVT